MFWFFPNWSVIALQRCISFCCPRRESVPCVQISPPSRTSLPHPPSGSSQSNALSFRRCSRFPLAVYTRYGCMPTLLSLSIPPSPSLPCPHVSSLHLHPYSCPANRFIHTIFFLDSTHMRSYTVFLFLFLTYFTPYGRL